jgi:hypothetical protein
MKQLIVAVTLLSATLWAQSGSTPDLPPKASPANGPSYSQLYCSGFVTRDAVPRTNYVLGSKESPHEDRFPGRTRLFLAGPDLVEGERYSIVRQVVDPNREDSSPEQRKGFAKLGAIYEDVGWVTVRKIEKGAAIASFDFACTTTVPGDSIVPFREKPAIDFRTTDPAIPSFLANSPTVRGQILGARDFLSILGAGQTVYTDFGGVKGAKPGDYLYVLRGYTAGDLNKIDRASERLPKGAEDTSYKPAKIKKGAQAAAPLHVLGEILVINTTPDSSTAIITRSFAEIGLGDFVEKEGQ